MQNFCVLTPFPFKKGLCNSSRHVVAVREDEPTAHALAKMAMHHVSAAAVVSADGSGCGNARQTRVSLVFTPHTKFETRI